MLNFCLTPAISLWETIGYAGEYMTHPSYALYTRAGTARGSGKGLAMEISGAWFYITPDEVPGLMKDQAADVVDIFGEREGTAWLSPMNHPRKQELTAMIRERVYMVPYRDLVRILAGKGTRAIIREFHSESLKQQSFCL